MKPNEVWVVELRRKGDSWAACTAAALTATEARILRSEYEERDPDDCFRIAKYREESKYEEILTEAIAGARSCDHVPEADLKRLEEEKVRVIAAWYEDGCYGPEHSCAVLVELKAGFATISEWEDTTGHGCQCAADVGFYRTEDEARRLGLGEQVLNG